MKNPILRLENVIDKAYDYHGKLPKGFSLADFRELELAYRNMKEHYPITTINSNVKAELERCGFTCSTHGIGWIVSK